MRAVIINVHGYRPNLYDAHIHSKSEFLNCNILDPVCVSIRPSFLFIDVSVIGLSETRYHTIVKICHQSGEFTVVDFSRDKASVTARLIPMNHVHV